MTLSALTDNELNASAYSTGFSKSAQQSFGHDSELGKKQSRGQSAEAPGLAPFKSQTQHAERQTAE
jgi:hypothetical protein